MPEIDSIYDDIYWGCLMYHPFVDNMASWGVL